MRSPAFFQLDFGARGRSLKSVTSADGTLIAYDQEGAGPPLVLVHGMTGRRGDFDLIRPGLQNDLTFTPMDRRGRGDSGDQDAYAIEREFEDILAVVNALDPPVILFGHSFGALCALAAAMQSDRLAGLILCEPYSPVGNEAPFTQAQLEQFDRLLASDDQEGILRMLLVDLVGIPAQEMEEITSEASWTERLPVARTVPREARAENGYSLPGEQAAKLTIPVLLILGGDSPPVARSIIIMLEEALPNARTVVMPGQQHIAMRTGPDLLAGAVLDFWRDIA